MPVTVQQTETILISRVGGFLAQCGMSTLASGYNTDLADAIASAVRSLDCAVANPAVPADSDLAAISDAKQELFLCVAHLYTIRTCAGRLAKADQKLSIGEVKFNQLYEQLKAEYLRLQADLLERFGFGRRRRSPKVGSITQGNTWPPLPPPPSSQPPWPATYTPPPGPNPASDITSWGFNP